MARRKPRGGGAACAARSSVGQWDARAWRRRSPRAYRLRSSAGCRSSALTRSKRRQADQAGLRPRRSRSILPRARAPSFKSLALPATIRPAAALSTATSRNAPFLPLSTSSSACAFSLGIAAAQSLRLDARQPGILRRDLERADLCHARAPRHWWCPAVVISSSPSEPCTTQTRSRAEIFQHLRHRLDPMPRKHADHLALDAGRVGQRSQQIEDGAGAELDPGRPDVLHRRMMRRREHEADAGFVECKRPTCSASRSILTPSAEQHIGCARLRRQGAVAMLGDRHAGARDDESRAGRNVERAGGVAAGADHVDGVGRRLHAQHLGAHGGDRAGDLVDGFAAHAQRHQESRPSARASPRPTSCGRRRCAASARVSARPGRDLADERFEIVGHERLQCAASAMRAVSARRPCAHSIARQGRGNSSESDGRVPKRCFRDGTARHAPASLRCVKAHDQTVVGLGGYVQLRAASSRARRPANDSASP